MLLICLLCNSNEQSVVALPQYPQFLAELMRVFLKILDEGEPQFIAEQNIQVGNEQNIQVGNE